MNVTIKVDDGAVRRALGEAQSQAKYAIALATNNVTKDAQKDVHAEVESRFQLRRGPFVLRETGKITTFATKASPAAVIEITEKVNFMWKFTSGEPKTPKDGRAIAVPVAVRRNANDIIPKSQRPPALYASKSAAAGRVFSKGGKLLQRVGRGAKATLKVLYLWKPSVRTPKLLRFGETIEKSVDKNWERRALEAVERALATMK